MRPEFLKLTPKRYRCPYCGKWHPWTGIPLTYYASSSSPIELKCTDSVFKDYAKPVKFYFYDGELHYKIESVCQTWDDTKGTINIKEQMVEHPSQPRITFYILINTRRKAGTYSCGVNCKGVDNCLVCKLGDEGNEYPESISLGFEFDEEEYYAIVGKKQKRKNKKEDNNMKKATTTSSTTIWDQLYKHSPEENVQIAKQWAGKYKPTLKWAVPVVTIYAAYRILNSKNSEITVKNIEEFSNKNLGFVFESLKDKKALNHLMQWGKVTVGAFAAMKAASAITNPKDLSVEQVEDGMEKLEGVKNKFGFIQPKTEALLPVAVSVIIVYIMTQKPAWFETAKGKVADLAGDLSSKTEVYSEIVKLFLADKLHINLKDEEEVQKAKKFAFLAAIIGVSVLLYGKKVIGAKDDDDKKTSAFMNQMQDFMAQVIGVMKKLMPTAFAGLATWLVSKEILEPDNLLEDSFLAEDDETAGEEAEETPNEAENEKENEEDEK